MSRTPLLGRRTSHKRNEMDSIDPSSLSKEKPRIFTHTHQPHASQDFEYLLEFLFAGPLLVVNDMQVLLLLALLALRHGRQVVVGGAPVALEVLECQAAELDGLDVEVLECLGLGVNVLVDELALDLVLGVDGPPEELVGVLCDGLQEGLGDVDVAALLHGFPLDEVVELGHGVLCGAVQLVRLGGCCVVVQHRLERHGDVDGVDGVEALLQPVGGDDVGGRSQAVEQTVLEAEHGGRANDGGLWVDGTRDLLTLGLGAVELGGRVDLGAVRGDVDIAVNVVLCHGLGDALGALDMDVGQVEVLGGVVATNEVVDNVRVPHALLNGCCVAQVHFHEDDAAKVTGDLEVALCHFLTERHNDGASRASCFAVSG